MRGSITIANPKWARQERNARRAAREERQRQRKRQAAAASEMAERRQLRERVVSGSQENATSKTHREKIMMQLDDELESQNQLLELPSYEKGCRKMAALLERMDTTPLPPPDNYVAIVEDAVYKFNHSDLSMSTARVLYRLYSGVLLDNGKKMYWVDRVSNKNCFMLFSQSLLIISPTIYTGLSFPTRVGEIERAVITDETRVEITGSFDTIVLSPSTVYVIAFVVRRQQGSSAPLRLEITLPSGDEIKYDRDLVDESSCDKWIEILGCEFLMSPENVGELKFVVKEDGGLELGRLEILGVCLRPKDNMRTSTSKDPYIYYFGSDSGIFPNESLSFFDRLFLYCCY